MYVIAVGQEELIKRMVAPPLPSGWTFVGARVEGPSIVARYAHPSEQGVAVLTLTHQLASEAVMVTQRFAVRWRVRPAGRDVTELARAVVAAVRATEMDFVWLLAASAREGEGEGAVFVLDPGGVAALLAPEVTVDGPAIAGFRLAAVRGLPAGPPGRVLLEFAPTDATEPIELLVAPADATEPLFASHSGVGIGLRHARPGDGVGRAALLCWRLLGLMARKLGPGARVEVSAPTDACPPADHDDPPTRPGTASPDPAPVAEVLVLNLNAECRQQCTFCPIKSAVTPHDGGALELQSLGRRLAEAAARGQRRAQLNGIDPLAFSQVLELTSAIRAAGFVELELMGPNRRFADDAFRAEFLRRSPADTRVIVPLYGVTGDVHDQVTDAPGAHAEVLRAIDGLRADIGPERLGLSTVITRHNVDEFVGLVCFARERSLHLWPQLPYPLRTSRHGAYANSALPESEIVARVLHLLEGATVSEDERAECLIALATAIRHPCVLWEAQRRSGVGAFDAARALPERVLTDFGRTDVNAPRQPGTARSLSTLQVENAPCGEALRCAARPVCVGEHYVAYTELFGVAEFTPVGVWDLRSPPDRVDLIAPGVPPRRSSPPAPH